MGRDKHIRHETCTCGEHRSRLIFSKPVNAVSLPLFVPIAPMSYGRVSSKDFIRQDEPKGGLLMAEVKVEARPNGPYVVTGSIELLDTNGNILSTQERTVLCRCGASTKKPFCDGTHSKIGFQAAAQAVPDSAEKS